VIFINIKSSYHHSESKNKTFTQIKIRSTNMAKGKIIKATYPKYVRLQPREPQITEWELSLERELRKLGYRCARYSK